MRPKSLYQILSELMAPMMPLLAVWNGHITMRNLILILGSLLVMVGCSDKSGDSGGSADSGGSSGGEGAALYSSNCASCHGADGEGGVGPSLVDNVPGSSESELTEVVTDGTGLMPPFGSSLSEEEIEAVVQFLLSEWG